MFRFVDSGNDKFCKNILGDKFIPSSAIPPGHIPGINSIHDSSLIRYEPRCNIVNVMKFFFFNLKPFIKFCLRKIEFFMLPLFAKNFSTMVLVYLIVLK